MAVKNRVILDMDGTIVDLWGYPGVYNCFMQSNVDCYRYARPLVEAESIRVILSRMLKNGYEIYVVSHNCKSKSRAYRRAVADAKAEWLTRYGIPYTKLVVVPYGTPKERYMDKTADINILIDDDINNRNAFRTAGGVAFDGADVITALTATANWGE